jgi:hypothetical protein
MMKRNGFCPPFSFVFMSNQTEDQNSFHTTLGVQRKYSKTVSYQTVKFIISEFGLKE